MSEKQERTSASPWLSLLGRVVVIAAALGVLAWIGRATTAGAAASVGAADAAVAELDAAPAASAVPVPTAVATAAPAAPAATRGRATPEDPVFLNQADETELRRLPGVGAKRAEAILTLRRRVGRFQRVEDLMRVKGIGRAAIKKWRPLVRLDAAPTPAPPDGGA